MHLESKHYHVFHSIEFVLNDLSYCLCSKPTDPQKIGNILGPSLYHANIKLIFLKWALA